VRANGAAREIYVSRESATNRIIVSVKGETGRITKVRLHLAEAIGVADALVDVSERHA
jgi:hypothetical protein